MGVQGETTWSPNSVDDATCLQNLLMLNLVPTGPDAVPCRCGPSVPHLVIGGPVLRKQAVYDLVHVRLTPPAPSKADLAAATASASRDLTASRILSRNVRYRPSPSLARLKSTVMSQRDHARPSDGEAEGQDEPETPPPAAPGLRRHRHGDNGFVRFHVAVPPNIPGAHAEQDVRSPATAGPWGSAGCDAPGGTSGPRSPERTRPGCHGERRALLRRDRSGKRPAKYRGRTCGIDGIRSRLGRVRPEPCLGHCGCSTLVNARSPSAVTR